MATPMSEELGWFTGVPDSHGEFLVIDNVYWSRHLADWIPGEGKRPGRWYVRSMPYCEADGIFCFRPLPRTPDRPSNNHSEV